MIVNLFVYGTLRVFPNDRPTPSSWGWNGTDRVFRNATIEGAMWFCRSKGSYPVVRVGDPGKVVGDMIEIDTDSAQWNRIYYVESGAGYTLVTTKATLVTGEVVNTYVWDYTKRRMPGHLKIEDGNWLAAVGNDWDGPEVLP